MPHPRIDWRENVAKLQESLNQERVAAREWKSVASALAGYLHHVDHALTIIVSEASSIERVFNVDAPEHNVPEAPIGSSGEEVYRHIRVKVRSVVSFVGHLAAEAVRAEQTILDAATMAQEALQTTRPASDLVPTIPEFDPEAWGLHPTDHVAGSNASATNRDPYVDMLATERQNTEAGDSAATTESTALVASTAVRSDQAEYDLVRFLAT